MKEKLTYERLHKLLNYNPETGVFTRKVKRNRRAKIGDVLGSKNNLGYIHIRIDRKEYLAHRLAWFYVYGYFPENYLDHINRNRADNRILNLREVSNSCNQRNTENHKTNTSGVKGVSFIKRDQAWRAKIRVDNKHINLGSYKDFDNAVCARLAAEQCLNWSHCDSLSPALQYVREHIQKQT